ncbi:MAG: right-handed parallel beta-helix repeat-containing protein [Spirochaetes bacterium]|nr:right-handed parallel beta-helix repeat-containing protein [Spirochaetota bacterium]
MKVIKFGAALLFAGIGGYAVYFFLGNGESVTPAEFPGKFITAAEFCRDKKQVALTFRPGEETKLQEAVNLLEDCTTISLGAGTFNLTNAITVAKTKGLVFRGAGKTQSILKFNRTGNYNGVDIENVRSLEISDLTIMDSPKNGLEIRLSEQIHINNVRATWSASGGPEKTKNGAYGIYPVNVKNILLENSESFYASDAGLYVGQCINAVVRKNRAEENVFGIEIENTINADVYDNVSRKNTGGFLIYDLHRNPIVGRNVRFFRNVSENNNLPNFAHSGIVKSVPAGTGMAIVAQRHVEVFGNRFHNNNTLDIGIVHGLVAEVPDLSKWPHKNFANHHIYIHDNDFGDASGGAIDNGQVDGKNRPLGFLIDMVFKEVNLYRRDKNLAALGVPNILFDGVDDHRTILALTNTFLGNRSGNRIQLCLRNMKNTSSRPSLVDMNLPALLDNSEEPTKASIRKAIDKKDFVVYAKTDNPLYGGAAPAGFDCTGAGGTGVPVAGLGEDGRAVADKILSDLKI